ncbi:MAG: hypothetical protein R3F17_11630 [Planctomycetota bacterium]
MVARVGPVEITTAELAGRACAGRPNPRALRQTCYEALLEKRIRLRFPDLAPAAFAQAVEVELDQRRADAQGSALQRPRLRTGDRHPGPEPPGRPAPGIPPS